MSKVKVTPPKVIYAKRLVYVCDQGHYGFTTCSNCSANVEGHYKKCPKCGAIFKKPDDTSYNTGGSDF